MVVDPVGFVFEAGKKPIPGFEGFEVLEDGAISGSRAFAGHEKRNPRRVGDNAHGDYAAVHSAYGQEFGSAVHQALVGGRRRQRGLGKRGNGLGLDLDLPRCADLLVR